MASSNLLVTILPPSMTRKVKDIGRGGGGGVEGKKDNTNIGGPVQSFLQS